MFFLHKKRGNESMSQALFVATPYWNVAHSVCGELGEPVILHIPPFSG